MITMKKLTLLVAGVSVLSILLWQLPKLSVPHTLQDVKQRVDVEDRARQTLIQVIGGIFFFVTAYATMGSLKVAQDNLRLSEANAQRNRELELYKIAFPKKFDAAMDFMRAATETVDEVSQFFVKTYDSSFVDDGPFPPIQVTLPIREKIDKFGADFKTQGWLFGSEFVGLVSELQLTMNGYFNRTAFHISGARRVTKTERDIADADRDLTAISDETIKFYDDTKRIMGEMSKAISKELHIELTTLSN